MPWLTDDEKRHHILVNPLRTAGKSCGPQKRRFALPGGFTNFANSRRNCVLLTLQPQCIQQLTCGLCIAVFQYALARKSRRKVERTVVSKDA